MKSFLVAGIAAAVFCSAPAAADWTGWYGGGFAGYGWGHESNTELSNAPNAQYIGLGDTWSGHTSGFVGGATLGYNYQVSSWVWGIEGDFGYLGIDGTNPRASFLGVIPVIDTSDTWFGTARARLGFAADRTLFFVTGGAAFADLKTRIRSVAGVPLITDTVGTTTGWTIGGGIEHAYDNRWSVKLEYLYLDFGSNDVRDSTTQAFVQPRSVEIKDHIVRVGLNYKFGGPIR